MRSNKLLIFLVLLIAVAFYFLGRSNGSNQTKMSVVQNVDLIKEIAELGALEVSGTTNLKMTNRDADESSWKKFKSYFVENTLQLSVPYDAKYGVDMSNQDLTVDTKAGTATIHLPAVKLLSLQLSLDKMDMMSQTGLLYSASMNDLLKAQKQLYIEALKSLENDQRHIKPAEEHIRFIMEKYYAPLGLKVTCIFGQPGKALIKN
ncbi:MAG: hypothetical protein JWQ27_1877 [Ferruginibacter sp.]|nr:hypothetical protein [Ferruginibacter sp.]